MSTIRRVIAGVLWVAAVGQASAEPPPPPKVTVPKWVYAAGAVGHVGKGGAEVIERGFRCESVEDAKQFSDVVVSTRTVLQGGPKLLTGKSTTLLKGYAGATAVDVALTGVELLTGRINTTQAVEAVLIGAVSRAGVCSSGRASYGRWVHGV